MTDKTEMYRLNLHLRSSYTMEIDVLHTKDAKLQLLEKRWKKEFSVTPNYPRFLREGDELVSNLN